MRHASGHNYRNSSFIVDVAMGQIYHVPQNVLCTSGISRVLDYSYSTEYSPMIARAFMKANLTLPSSAAVGLSSCWIALMPVVYQVVGFGRGDGRHSGRHRRSECNQWRVTMYNIATAAMSWVQIKEPRKNTHVATVIKPTDCILYACLSRN